MRHPYRIDFPPALPISARAGEIVDAITIHQVLILAGETGSGKSTQIPKMCLAAGRGVLGRIACTQPRRVAALALSRRLAEEMGVSWGHEVGCKVRFNDNTSRDTLVKFMTDGMLLAEAQGDPFLQEYDTIVIDEAHERSLNIDFLLGHLRQLRARRPELKIVITSATIDTAVFSKAFGDAPVIVVEGRVYPVEVLYFPLDGMGSDAVEGDEGASRGESLHYVEGAVESAERISRDSTAGDILVFMPSERDIREACDILGGRLRNWEVVPLFGRLTNEEQRRIFTPGQQRRIVVATNIAETSLTIPGIRFVVDTGLARISRYSPKARTLRLPIEAISRSSADQRKGRCGRVADGVCVRLFSEEDYLGRPQFTQPEIQRANLADVILRLKAHGMGDVETFPFIDPPAPKAVRSGYLLLEELGALTAGDGHQLTPTGNKLARLPIDPTAGRMILQAIREKAVREVLVIASGLCIQDPRERPQEKRLQADAAHRRFIHPDSDFLTLLNIWDAFHAEVESLSQGRLRAFCRNHHLSYIRMREWRDVHVQISQALGGSEGAAPSSVFDGTRSGGERSIAFGSPLYRSIHRSILAGLLGNIAVLDEENGGYRAAHDRRVVLFPGSALTRRESSPNRNWIHPASQRKPEGSPRWIMAAEMVETTRLYARTCARIDPAWALEIGAHLVQRSYSDPFWNSDSGRVQVKQKSRLYGLEIDSRAVSYGAVDPVRATEIFIREGLVNDTVTWPFSFIENNRSLRQRLEGILTRTRNIGFLSLDEAAYRFYAARLNAISAVADLVKLVRERLGSDPRFLVMTQEDLVGSMEETVDSHHFPAALPIENRALPLHYAYRPGKEDDGATLTLSIREIDSLTLANLDWAVTGHLLEKVEHYLRALPKEQRKRFVPLAETARALADDLAKERKDGAKSKTVAEALVIRVKSRYGLSLDPAVWLTKPLPERLILRIRVVDDAGNELATGRDLDRLRASLAEAERTGAVTLHRQDPDKWVRARSRFEQGPQTSWTFRDIPPRVVVSENAGVSVYGYPGLNAEAKGVALRLFQTPQEAEQAGKQGLAALFEIQLGNELAWLHRDLEQLSSLGAALAMLKSSRDLREDAYHCIRVWLCSRLVEPLTLPNFMSAVSRSKEDSNGLVPKFVAEVSRISTLRQDLLVENHPYPGLMADIDRLVPPNYLRITPYEQLIHFPRYLKAMKLRAAKRRENQARDDERARQLEPFASMAGVGNQLRWLVEEFRVSLFAQELGTSIPISRVKLERAMAAQKIPAGESKLAASARAAVPGSLGSTKLKTLRSLDGIFLR